MKHGKRSEDLLKKFLTYSHDDITLAIITAFSIQLNSSITAIIAMSEVEHLIVKTKELLANSNAEDALKLLSHYANNETYINNVKYLNILGETLLENSEVEEAYSIYSRSIELDPQGQVSVDGFFNLGQIVGGRDGLQLIIKGCDILENNIQNSNNTNSDNDEENRVFNVKKLTQGYFSQIEIWMTDLCMEDEAESQCETLISKAIALDEQNPESWSLLASIRISQQKPEEAQQHISKSWELFNSKKQKLEDSADVATSSADVDKLSDSNVEYIELIQPLITLTRFAIEVGQFDLAATISSNIHDISDDLLEPFYLEAFSNYLGAKSLQYEFEQQQQSQNNQQQQQQQQSSENRLEAINNVKLQIDSEGNGVTKEISEYLLSALYALSNGQRILYADETADPEVKQQIWVLVEELGGKAALKRAEKMLKSEGAAVTEENWEDEIQE